MLRKFWLLLWLGLAGCASSPCHLSGNPLSFRRFMDENYRVEYLEVNMGCQWFMD